MTRRRTVLCVDDNAALVDNLREILEDAGYATRAASSFASALEAGRAGFDVALVDLRLPDGDGTTLATRLRELAPDGQVIFLTGFATVESAIAAVRAGAWAYLVKPCAPRDLLLAVEQAVRLVVSIEEKRELQRRAQIAEKLATIGTLTAGLSHEIKNPLNAITLQLAVLERRIRRVPDSAQPSLVEPLRLVQDEVTRLNRILEEFLQFARPRELRAAAINIETVLAHVADLLALEAQRAEVQLECRCGSMPRVQGEEGRLQQAIVNLVLNAIQATPPGGFVRIEAEAGEEGVLLAVEDSGPGIPEELRPRIFEPFFTTKAAGSGLGLPLVHSIVEQHRGSITIERGAAGGARFVLRLPSAIPGRS